MSLASGQVTYPTAQEVEVHSHSPKELSNIIQEALEFMKHRITEESEDKGTGVLRFLVGEEAWRRKWEEEDAILHYTCPEECDRLVREQAEEGEEDWRKAQLWRDIIVEEEDDTEFQREQE